MCHNWGCVVTDRDRVKSHRGNKQENPFRVNTFSTLRTVQGSVELGILKDIIYDQV